MAGVSLDNFAEVDMGVIPATSFNNQLVGLLFNPENKPSPPNFPYLVPKRYPSAAAVYQDWGRDSFVGKQATIYFGGTDLSEASPTYMFVSSLSGSASVPTLLSGDLSGFNYGADGLSSVDITLVVNGVVTEKTLDLSKAKTIQDLQQALSTAFTNVVVSVVGTTLSIQPQVQASSSAPKTQSSADVKADVSTATTAPASPQVVPTIQFATGEGADLLMLSQASGALIIPAKMTNGSDILDYVFGRTYADFIFASTDDISSADLKSWITVNKNKKIFIINDKETKDITKPETSLPFLFNGGNPADINTATDLETATGGVVFVRKDDIAAMFATYFATLDFAELAGRTIAEYRSQSGIVPDVTDDQTKAQMDACGYNYYFMAADADLNEQGLCQGTITGPFAWADAYANMLLLRRSLQVAAMTTLKTTRYIPRSDKGVSNFKTCLVPSINKMIDFGGIQSGIVLDAQQVQRIEKQFGKGAAQVIQSTGYLIAFDTSSLNSSGRIKRDKAVFYVLYTDGSAIQSVQIYGYEVQ